MLQSNMTRLMKTGLGAGPVSLDRLRHRPGEWVLPNPHGDYKARGDYDGAPASSSEVRLP